MLIHISFAQFDLTEEFHKCQSNQKKNGVGKTTVQNKTMSFGLSKSQIKFAISINHHCEYCNDIKILINHVNIYHYLVNYSHNKNPLPLQNKHTQQQRQRITWAGKRPRKASGTSVRPPLESAWQGPQRCLASKSQRKSAVPRLIRDTTSRLPSGKPITRCLQHSAFVTPLHMKMYPAGDDMEDPLEQPFSSFSAAECGLSHTREGAVGDMEHCNTQI